MKFRLPAFIKRNFLRKAVALFFAFLTWFAINNRLQEIETFHDVPVTLRYSPNEITVKNKVYTADVMLRGSQDVLQRVKSSDVRISADIPVIPKGVYTFDLHLSPDNVSTPPGTEVVSIQPQNIRVPLDRIITKNIEVKVRDNGRTAPGYFIVKRKAVPSEVTATGPSKIVSEIDNVKTEFLVLDKSRKESFEIDGVKVTTPAKVNVHPEEVHISYVLSKKGGKKTYENLDVKVVKETDSKGSVMYDFPSVAVTLKGSEIVLEELDESSIMPFVKIGKLESEEKIDLPVRVWFPKREDVTVEKVEPSTVTINTAPD